jgi:hypothetical protein
MRVCANANFQVLIKKRMSTRQHTASHVFHVFHFYKRLSLGLLYLDTFANHLALI